MADRTSLPRWIFRVVGVGAVLALVYLAVIAVQVVSASRLDQREQVDAIVVLGAAQYDGTPSPALQRRLDRALELYRDGLADEIVLTGSKQPADRFTEAFSGFRYLVGQGVPEDDLRIVDDGASTYESLAAARRVLRGEGADRVLLVSDSYHNRRLQGIARELGMEPYVAPTDGSPTVGQIIGET
ncbi:MAG: YdcF family protein, partial [Actinomycetota bacterium]|nr:YdcF family protein [Actinomycetota bacterium]